VNAGKILALDEKLVALYVSGIGLVVVGFSRPVFRSGDEPFHLFVKIPGIGK
jgi:hypothetical protein